MAAKRIPMGHKRRGETTRAYDPRGAAARKAAYRRRVAGARASYNGRAMLQTRAEYWPSAVNAEGRPARSWDGLP